MDIQEYGEGRMSDNLKTIYQVESYFFGFEVRSKKKSAMAFLIFPKLQTFFDVF